MQVVFSFTTSESSETCVHTVIDSQTGRSFAKLTNIFMSTPNELTV